VKEEVEKVKRKEREMANNYERTQSEQEVENLENFFKFVNNSLGR
jgi:hypothetical protein